MSTAITIELHQHEIEKQTMALIDGEAVETSDFVEWYWFPDGYNYKHSSTHINKVSMDIHREESHSSPEKCEKRMKFTLLKCIYV